MSDSDLRRIAESAGWRMTESRDRETKKWLFWSLKRPDGRIVYQTSHARFATSDEMWSFVLTYCNQEKLGLSELAKDGQP